MDTLMTNRHIAKLVTAFLAIVSLFFAVKFFAELKSYGYIGGQYPPQNVISVSGHGEVFSIPDVAEITFDVTGEAKTVPDAQKKVTDTMNAILVALKKSGIADKDVKTVGYNIYPKYEYQSSAIACAPGVYCPPNGRQVLTGYAVTHSIDLKVRKTDEAGKILSDLGTMGVTNLSGINFTVDNQDSVKDDARSKAITDAKEKADILAKELGVHLVRIINFSESGNYPIYYAKAATMDSAGYGGAVPPTPAIPAGENKITSDVTVTYEIR